MLFFDLHLSIANGFANLLKFLINAMFDFDIHVVNVPFSMVIVYLAVG